MRGIPLVLKKNSPKFSDPLAKMGHYDAWDFFFILFVCICCIAEKTTTIDV